MSTTTNTLEQKSASAAGSPLYIDRQTVERLLKPLDLLHPLENAFLNFSRSHVDQTQVRGSKSKGEDPVEVVQPVRTVLSVKPHNGFLAVMPGYVSDVNAMATKLVTFYPNNRDLPTHQAWIALMNPSNGGLLAIIDGDSVTEMRTGVASAVATKYLASSDSKILALLGSGVQARSHYRALTAIHQYTQVRVWSHTEANGKRLADEIGGVYCSSVREAVCEADVICTLTFATTPILQLDWVKSTAHINAVGACRPDWSELDPALMNAAVVYCDTKEACLKEAGDIVISKCPIYAEIGEVIGGDKQAHRDKLTVFKSVGMAVEDVVSSKIVYDKYQQQL